MQRLRYIALIVWAVGVQVHEIPATVGYAVFAATWLFEFRKITINGLEKWGVLLGFVGWSLAAPTLTGNPPDGAGLARTLDWAVIPLVAMTAETLTAQQWRTLAKATFITLAISCVVAGLQHFGIWPSEAAFQPWLWTRIPFHRVYEPIADSGRFMGGGLIFHRLKFAHVSGLVLVAVLVAARRSEKKPLLIACGVLAFIAVWMFPYARMGAVAMTAAVALTLVLISPSPRLAFLTSAGLVLVAVIAVVSIAPLRDRFAAALTDQGSGQRSQHFNAGLEAIRQFPLAGVGPGQFRPSKFGPPDMPEHVRGNPGKAHNEFVSIAAETGIFGALLFIGLLVSLVRKARVAPLGALTIGCIGLFVVLSLVHDPLFQAPFSMGLVLILGLGLGSTTQAPEPTK